MERFWTCAQEVAEGDPVWRYLQLRVPGLDYLPRWVRFHPNLEYWQRPDDPNSKPTLLGRFPAMLAKAFDVHGRFVQLHKTYLTREGLKANVPIVKKTDLGVGVNGFAVPMQPLVGDTLGFAEGIESALAGSMVRRIPVWPCLNGPSMASYAVPEKLLQQVKNVVIFADNDERRRIRVAGSEGGRMRSAGMHFAEQLSQTVRSQGKRVMIIKAAKVGHDMADYWEGSNCAALN
jgi:putative DNA primase/helicase